MTEIHSIRIEVKKDSFGQLQSGAIKITLTCDPQEMDQLIEFVRAPAGQRYVCALAEIGDDEQPVEREKTKNFTRSQRAWQLCEGETFRQFMIEMRDTDIRYEEAQKMTAADLLRNYLNVESRSELDTDRNKAVDFDELIRTFGDYQRRLGR